MPLFRGGEIIPFAVHYTKDGVGVTGLEDVTISIWRRDIVAWTKSNVVPAGSCSEVGDGVYDYPYTSAAGYFVYWAIGKTAGDVDQKHIAAFALTDTDAQEDIVTLVARLGAFTGTGVNTVLGMFQALASKVATLPSDIGGTFSPATDSVEALQELGATILADTGTDGVVLADNAITAAKIATDAIGSDELAASATSKIATANWAYGTRTLTSLGTIVADVVAAVVAAVEALLAGIMEDVWSYDTRTLTQTAAQVTAAVEGPVLNIKRGDTNTLPLTGIGSLADRKKLWVTIKLRKSVPDSGAIIQIKEAVTGGLLYLNGAAPTEGMIGTLRVDNEDVGNVTIILNPVAAAVLEEANDLYYDVQKLTTDDEVHTIAEGTCNIALDVTQAIS